MGKLNFLVNKMKIKSGLVRLWTIFSLILMSTILVILILYSLIARRFGAFSELFLSCVLISFLFSVLGIIFIRNIIKKILIISEILSKISLKSNFENKDEKNKHQWYSDEIDVLLENTNKIMFEIEASEKIKNDFISSMSHELRTPLTAIKGWAETIKTGDEIDFSTVRRGLDIIAKETQRLTEIVKDLLDFSAMEGGRFEMFMEKIDLLAEVGEAVYIFKEKAALEKKLLIYNDPKEIPPILGDKNRLRQVFVNVIDNALKYVNEGGNVGVNVSNRENHVFIEITDDGCGIPKEEIPKITRKFYKVNPLRGGSGIGLAIVKEIISAHNGSIEILSEENFGTVVTISLPVYDKLVLKPQNMI
ncbi:MAG: HAMP domain-containing histidine kinase [Oscillospiraceae bacterium]|jgi:signal transduction histidine kinase|nr:HAMP domain-containing histidine kinase [Oscillospiraceae bacterium]